jgi:hypothetical protein
LKFFMNWKMSEVLSLVFGIQFACMGIYLGIVKLEYAFASLFVFFSAFLFTLVFMSTKNNEVI